MVQWGTKKTETIQDMEDSVLQCTQQTDTLHNHSRKCNNCVWASLGQPAS